MFAMEWNRWAKRKYSPDQGFGVGPGGANDCGTADRRAPDDVRRNVSGGAQSGGTCRGTAARPVNDEDGQKKLAGKK